MDKKIVFILSIVFVVFIVILLFVSSAEGDFIDSFDTATSGNGNPQEITTNDTIESGGDTAVNEELNITYNGVSIPLEDYLNVFEKDGRIKFETLDNKTCSLEPEYVKKNILSVSDLEINITKKSGGYYFTTDVGVEVNNMMYKMNCSGFEIRFEDNKFLMDNIKIDFNEALDKQNISTIYNAQTQKLIFFPDKDRFGKDKIADLSFIDPDIIIDSSVLVNLNFKEQPRSLVWIDKDTGYVFFIDNFGKDLRYRKTTDAGASWGTNVAVRTGTVEKFAIWYDKWTDGDTGDVIHTAFIDSGDDDIIYNSFSVSDDTLDGEVTVFAGTSVDTGNWDDSGISIVKARGGNVYVGGWINATGGNGFWRATDSPATSFSNRTDVTDGNEVDRIMFLTGNEADSNDIWSIYQDVSANEITLKVYDDSANSWSESSSIDTIVEVIDAFSFDSIDRHSDGHAILVMWNLAFNTGADLAVHDITNISTFSEKTDVVTGLNTRAITGLLLNQQNDDLYVQYLTVHSVGQIVYKLSTDGGTSWGSQTAMSVTGDDHRITIGGSSVGDDGGRWMPIWHNDDLRDLVTNKDNSIEIAAVSVDTCTYSSGNWDVTCSDNCVITSDVGLPSNSLFLDGSGSFTILANITIDKLIKDINCQLINKVADGNSLIIKNG